MKLLLFPYRKETFLNSTVFSFFVKADFIINKL